ncbi:hypothetical protein [Parasphingorhabdus sp.]|uniref:hypothetical protein n=1 Tax=Parasphingorhabdus sp. TaxID=2709688 RepID=UPI003D26665B
MAVNKEPQSAADYQDRTTEAVKSVIVELGQILGSYKGKFAIIGGSVPWLLLDQQEMPHVGTIDVDLGLDPVALAGGEYSLLVEELLGQGYLQSDSLQRFQLMRPIEPKDGSATINVIVDFLMPKDAVLVKNGPKFIENFAVQKADGADLAIAFQEFVKVEGDMPTGGKNRVEIAVCTIPALLAMKGHALNGRHKQKDAYDVYYCIRNYPDGIDALAEECQPVLAESSGAEGYQAINEKFEAIDSYGPTSVCNFVAETDILGERSADEWQQDAFGQIDAWLRALGLRK